MSKHNLKVLIFSVSLIFLLGMAYIFLLPIISDYKGRIKFNSEQWKNADAVDNGIRIKMVDDLIHHDKLAGMTREQIILLLGEPASHGYFEEYDLVYWLGPERGFISIDSEWLCINLKNGIVGKYKVCRD